MRPVSRHGVADFADRTYAKCLHCTTSSQYPDSRAYYELLKQLLELPRVEPLLDQRRRLESAQVFLVHGPVVAVDHAEGYSLAPLQGPGEGGRPVRGVVALLQLVHPLLVPFKGIHMIEGNARLQYLDVGEPFVLDAQLDNAGEVVDVGREATCG